MFDYLFLAILANFITWWFSPSPVEEARAFISAKLEPSNSWWQELLYSWCFCPKCQSFLFAIVYAIVAKDLLALMIVPFLAEIIYWLLREAGS